APAAAPPAAPTRVANAAPAAQDEGWFSSLARKVGLGGSADATASTPPSKPKAPEAKQAARPEAPKAAAPKPEVRQAASRPPLKPSLSDTPPAAGPAVKETQVSGSAPTLSS